MSTPKIRPKRRKSVRKDENIHIRVTTEQKALLSAAADSAGLGLSSWMLTTSLSEAKKKTDKGGQG